MKHLFTKNPTLIFRHPDIMAVYLFGSQTINNITNKSDYDLAVFVNNINKISQRELLKKIIDSFSLPEKLHLTLVDLTHSSSVLLYQIIKNGRLIYERLPYVHISLESLVMRLYFDDQFRNNIYYQSLKNQYAY